MNVPLYCAWDTQSPFYNPPQLLKEWPVKCNHVFHWCFFPVLRDKPAWLNQMLEKYYHRASSWDIFILTALTSFFHILFGGSFRDFLYGFYTSNWLNVLIRGWCPSADYKSRLYTLWWTVSNPGCVRIKRKTKREMDVIVLGNVVSLSFNSKPTQTLIQVTQQVTA